MLSRTSRQLYFLGKSSVAEAARSYVGLQPVKTPRWSTQVLEQEGFGIDDAQGPSQYLGGATPSLFPGHNEAGHITCRPGDRSPCFKRQQPQSYAPAEQDRFSPDRSRRPPPFLITTALQNAATALYDS